MPLFESYTCSTEGRSESRHMYEIRHTWVTSHMYFFLNEMRPQWVTSHMKWTTTSAMYSQWSGVLLQRDAVRCSVLQCVAVCCSVLQCNAVCCGALQCGAVCTVCYSVLQCAGWACAPRMSHVTHIKWVTSRKWNESCHTYEMIHITHMKWVTA